VWHLASAIGNCIASCCSGDRHLHCALLQQQCQNAQVPWTPCLKIENKQPAAALLTATPTFSLKGPRQHQQHYALLQKCLCSASNGIRTTANKCGIVALQLENCSMVTMAFVVAASLYIAKLGHKNN